jgi:hypothetical protein
VLAIYQDIKQETEVVKHSFAAKKLTEQFGLPLAVAEYKKELVGFASAKLAESEEIEIAFYYKKEVNQTDIQPLLEQQAISNFNLTFDKDEEAVEQLKQASQTLITWLNKYS